MKPRRFWKISLGTALLAVLVLLAALTLRDRLRPPAAPVTVTWAAPDFPDTPAGKQFEGYIAALNANNTETLSQFVIAHFSRNGPQGVSRDIKDRIPSQLRFYDISRGLNPYQVEATEAWAATMIAQFRLTGEWRRLTMYVEETPPHLITGIRIEPTEAPQVPEKAPTTDATMGEQLDAHIKKLVAADRFSGVVLVAKDGVPLFEGAYGLADVETQRHNTVGSRFNLASTGKMFTAVAVAQLVEQGKLAYDQPISAYLPTYPTETGQRVTIHHLLTHSSGIVDFFEDEARFATVQGSRNPQRDYMALFQDEPLRFTPGERFEYSNSNYILLGAIIEQLSGESFEDYLQAHIFTPAGMSATTLSPDGIDPATIAKGYTELGPDGVFTPGTRRPAASKEPAVGSAAGGGWSTVGDLLRFEQALRNHRLVGAAATETLFTKQLDADRPGYGYGYGFMVREADGERVVGHSGGFPGVDSQFEMYLESGYSVIILSNYELVAEPVMMWVQQQRQQ